MEFFYASEISVVAGYVPTGGACPCRFGLVGKPTPFCGDKPDDSDWD